MDDFIVYVTEKQMDYKAIIQRAKKPINRLVKWCREYPYNRMSKEEYLKTKEQIKQMKQQLKALIEEQNAYLQSEEYKQEIDRLKRQRI